MRCVKSLGAYPLNINIQYNNNDKKERKKQNYGNKRIIWI